MNIAEKYEFLETAIRCAFRDALANGYSIEVYDDTEDYFEEGANAVLFYVQSSKTLIDGYGVDVGFVFRFEDDKLSMSFSNNMYCGDIDAAEKAIARYTDAGFCSEWEISGKSVLSEFAQEIVDHPEEYDQDEEYDVDELITTDYSSTVSALKELVITDENEIEVFIKKALLSLVEGDCARALKNVFACYNSETDPSAVVFDWEDSRDKLILASKKIEGDRFEIQKGAGFEVYLSGVYVSIDLNNVGFILGTPPSLFKEGNISFLGKNGLPLEAVIDGDECCVAVNVSKQYNADYKLVESILKDGLKGFNITVDFSGKK